MKAKLKGLVEKAHTWFRFMSQYYAAQEEYNKQLIGGGIKSGNPLNPEFMAMVSRRDINLTNMPYKVAKELIKGRCYQEDIQNIIDSLDNFKKYNPDTFANFGIFISIMMQSSLNSVPELNLKTINSPVHVPRFYIPSGKKTEDSYPWDGLEALEEYNRDNLLISDFCSNLANGKIIIEGNVGNFFAIRNNGSTIQLNGECGWRPCYDHLGGQTIINGTAGHELCLYAGGGQIHVNGTIKSLGGHYTTAYGHEIFLNGKLLPKEDVGPPPDFYKSN